MTWLGFVESSPGTVVLKRLKTKNNSAVRHFKNGLKILFLAREVRVQVPPRAPIETQLPFLVRFSHLRSVGTLSGQSGTKRVEIKEAERAQKVVVVLDETEGPLYSKVGGLTFSPDGSRIA